jgi:putative membrane protein
MMATSARIAGLGGSLPVKQIPLDHRRGAYAAARATRGGRAMQHMMEGGCGPGMMLMLGVMGLGTLLVLAAVVAGVVWMVRTAASRRRDRPRDPQASSGATPLDVLRRRYAAGEVSREEFERMRQELKV